MSFPERTGKYTKQPTWERDQLKWWEKSNTWSLKPWWGKQITLMHLFTWQDRNSSTVSIWCFSLGNKCLQLKVNDAFQQGCRHQPVDRVKQRSAAVGHIDSVIYCLVSCSFTWVRNSSSIPRHWEPVLEKETFALINLKRSAFIPQSLFVLHVLLASIYYSWIALCFIGCLTYKCLEKTRSCPKE